MESVGPNLSLSVSTKTKKYRSSTTTLATTSTNSFRDGFLLKQQFEAVKAELQHERSMRAIDQKRNAQQLQSLEKQLEFAKNQADQANALVQQVQQESEQLTSSLRESRNQVLEELRDCQLELEDRLSPDDSAMRLLEEENTQLRRQIETQAEYEISLKQELESLRQNMENKLQQQTEAAAAASDGDASSPTRRLVEDAPPAVLRELNQTRVTVADTERQLRKIERKLEATEQRNKSLIQEREQARNAAQRLESVEQILAELRKQHADVIAQNQTWKEFGVAIAKELARQGILFENRNGPPEVATILRFLEKTQVQATELERLVTRQEQELEKLQVSAKDSDSNLKATMEEAKRARRVCADLEKKLDESEMKAATLKAQQSISEREISSLRSLIKTYEDMPFVPAVKMTGEVVEPSSPSLDTSSKLLEFSLSSTKAQLEVVSKERDDLIRELTTAKSTVSEKERELDTIREKFGKLREALYAERAKVALAEERANRAESLAGKGSFNPDRTRVLHMTETPLTEALKEEIKVLQRQLEVLKGGQKSSKHAPDPEKLNKRLKENFKEQIGLFREGVYLMTGYKVDMLPGTERPTFRVRSVFAEREDDHFLLQWPKGSNVTSLDILNTDFAKVVATTPSYEYMTKCHSLPAFMASVQLTLFEKQTVML